MKKLIISTFIILGMVIGTSGCGEDTVEPVKISIYKKPVKISIYKKYEEYKSIAINQGHFTKAVKYKGNYKVVEIWLRESDKKVRVRLNVLYFFNANGEESTYSYVGTRIRFSTDNTTFDGYISKTGTSYGDGNGGHYDELTISGTFSNLNGEKDVYFSRSTHDLTVPRIWDIEN